MPEHRSPDSLAFPQDHDTDLDFHSVFIGNDFVLPAGHQYGPILRDHFIVQYCPRGKGVFTLNGKSFSVHAGQAFFSYPNSVMIESADETDPWGLMWVEFKSHRVKFLFDEIGMTEESPVFSLHDSAIIYSHIKALADMPVLDDAFRLAQTGHLYLMFSDLIQSANAVSKTAKSLSNRKYIQAAIQYIEHNYTEPIKVTDISTRLGLNRSYFYSLFKKQIGMSPQEYLLKFRIKKACDLLASPHVTIANVAYSVGCEPRVLSRIFKQMIGMTPSQYKAQLKNK